MRAGDVFTATATLSQQSAPVNAPIGITVPASAISVSYAGSGNYVVSLFTSLTGVYSVVVSLNGVPLSAGAYSLSVRKR